MDMISEKSLRIAFVIMFLIFLMTLLTLNKSTVLISEKTKDLEKIKLELDSLQFAHDSMYAELYPCQIELNRYEIAYEIFMKRNPKAASQYGDIISNETE